jgi:hypothetical protein
MPALEPAQGTAPAPAPVPAPLLSSSLAFSPFHTHNILAPIPAPTRYHQIVDLTFSDDPDEKEGVHDTTTTTTSFTTANTTPATASSGLKILSNRNGVSYAFDGSFGSKEATTDEGRTMLREEYRVHHRLKKKSRLGAGTYLKDLPVVLGMAWSDTCILQRGTLGGFVMRHVDSG